MCENPSLTVRHRRSSTHLILGFRFCELNRLPPPLPAFSIIDLHSSPTGVRAWGMSKMLDKSVGDSESVLWPWSNRSDDRPLVRVGHALHASVRSQELREDVDRVPPNPTNPGTCRLHVSPQGCSGVICHGYDRSIYPLASPDWSPP
eukprot:2550441-Pyramimonas_sp.AAC.1